MQPTTNQERQKLDFEDEESRRARLGKLFSDISKSDTTNDDSSTPLDINNLNRTRPHAVPESDVLARVKAFLPQFQESTTALLHQASLDPNAVNLENINKGERVVAMDLGLGVYDAPGLAAGQGIGMEGRGLGPIVESDPSGLEGMDQDDEEEEEDGDEDEDASDSSSSDSSDDGEEEEEEEEGEGDSTTKTTSTK